MQKESLTYKSAGVDIDAGDKLVENIKPLAKSTRREGCLDGLGGFGAMFEIPEKYNSPVLVSGTDGVGTKLRLAIEKNKHDTIGIDLVAMCCNDILAQGAEPLYFLDYFATGKLDVDHATSVIKGIADGCKLGNMALIGGETAEMPGMYGEGDYDLAGFCVGVVEKSRIITGQNVAKGDTLIALPSSGPHSNGYSLIRKVLEVSGSDINTKFQDTTLIDALLAPTEIYVKAVLSLLETVTVNGIAHITGGGITGNVNRIMPKDCDAIIEKSSWEMPAIFAWLAENGNIVEDEMYRTFNCGAGLVIAVSPEKATDALNKLQSFYPNAWIIGHVADGQGKVQMV